MDRRQRKHAQALLNYEQTLAEVREQEAIRSAEEFVCSAWIGRLLEAEQVAVQAVRACAHMRAQRADALRIAQEIGDPRLIVEAQDEFETVEQDCVEGRLDYERVRELLAAELDSWTAATRERVTAALADKDRLEAALEAVPESARPLEHLRRP